MDLSLLIFGFEIIRCKKSFQIHNFTSVFANKSLKIKSSSVVKLVLNKKKKKKCVVKFISK